MFRAIAALALISAAGVAAATTASAVKSPSAGALLSASPWWEKVTVTIAGNGKPQSCRYESSLRPNDAQQCDVVSSQASMVKSAMSSDQELTRITFERRFSPGAQPEAAKLQTGDTLLGQQVMAIGIDAKGAVKDCRIVSSSGEMKPDYGCDDATAEHFEASATTARTAPPREGLMTILVYGHSEHMV
ncbi:MAG TPA: hypothetical protein VIV07_08440 [Sphingomicrobium sp.]